MKARYHMQSSTHVIEAKPTDKGKAYLVRIRKEYPRFFKHARIKKILQALPSQIELNKISPVCKCNSCNN